eukprot:CAMPEP_0184869722 /NCGR_PEP_ID=MMETSP0580-20130426/35051_1 /TAXON_ID=1118495 /ORGANISM="Dactyliosolen fragilissimus" /LENGTH=273 /DNA_ID=CAMNT_0027371381 /DNA_START=259 /DNA_END=1080 /DNA_ORIENTATION=-
MKDRFNTADGDVNDIGFGFYAQESMEGSYNQCKWYRTDSTLLLYDRPFQFGLYSNSVGTLVGGLNTFTFIFSWFFDISMSYLIVFGAISFLNSMCASFSFAILQSKLCSYRACDFWSVSINDPTPCSDSQCELGTGAVGTIVATILYFSVAVFSWWLAFKILDFKAKHKVEVGKKPAMKKTISDLESVRSSCNYTSHTSFESTDNEFEEQNSTDVTKYEMDKYLSAENDLDTTMDTTEDDDDEYEDEDYIERGIEEKESIEIEFGHIHGPMEI